MTTEELLAELDLPVPGGRLEDDAEIEVQAADARSGPPSPTALELDDWSLRRGAEVLESSERMQEMFELGDTEKPKDTLDKAALATADFHAAAFEPAPKLAERCENPTISRYMQQLFETPEFQALHNETQLDEVASEIAAASFAEQYVVLAKTEPTGDAFKDDMAALKACSNALKDAASDVSDLRDAQSALGLGGNGAQPGAGLAGQSLLDVFKRVRGSHQLKRICELAGRYRRFAQAKQRTKVLHGRDDVVGVVLGDDPARLLPHELAALGDEDLELDAMRRIVESQAMCREYRGVATKARGPIVVTVDESGSMGGEPIYTAKAIALALYWVAQHQRRWCCLVGFSGGTEGTWLAIPPGSPKQAELMEWLEHFYGGGTTMDVPLVELPKNWEALGCPKGKTDIIMITDAIVHVPEEMRKSFLAWKAAERVKLQCMIINEEPGDLELVADRVHKVRSLSMEESAVGEVLSI